MYTFIYIFSFYIYSSTPLFSDEKQDAHSQSSLSQHNNDIFPPNPNPNPNSNTLPFSSTNRENNLDNSDNVLNYQNNPPKLKKYSKNFKNCLHYISRPLEENKNEENEDENDRDGDIQRERQREGSRLFEAFSKPPADPARVYPFSLDTFQQRVSSPNHPNHPNNPNNPKQT